MYDPIKKFYQGDAPGAPSLGVKIAAALTTGAFAIAGRSQAAAVPRREARAIPQASRSPAGPVDRLPTWPDA